MFWRNKPRVAPRFLQISAGGASLDVDNISVSYSPSLPPVLNTFTITAAPGEIVSVLGRSGSGKTTALRAIAGFEHLTAGYLRIGGQLVASSFVHLEPEKRRVGMVFQDYAIFPHLTVAENVAFGLTYLDKAKRLAKVRAMLNMTDLSGVMHKYAAALSGGQQQRIALARAIAPSPTVLLLDEPFSNLDKELSEIVRKQVKHIIKSAGVTTVLVTHNGEEALAMADKLAIMGVGGRVEQFGAPEQVYQHPVSPAVARMVGPCEFLPGIIKKSKIATEAGIFTPTSSAQSADSVGTIVLPMEQMPEGSRVTVVMRPPDLEILPPFDTFKGRIVGKEFMGEFTEFTIRLPSAARIRVRQRSSTIGAMGDTVSVGQRDGCQLVVFPGHKPI